MFIIRVSSIESEMPLLSFSEFRLENNKIVKMLTYMLADVTVRAS